MRSTSAFFEAVQAEIMNQAREAHEKRSFLAWLDALLHPDSGPILAAELCAALDRGDDPVQSCQAAVRLALEARDYSPLRVGDVWNPFKWGGLKAQAMEQAMEHGQLVTDEILRRQSAVAALSEHAERTGIRVTNHVLRFDDDGNLAPERSAVALSDHATLDAPELALEPLVASKP